MRRVRTATHAGSPPMARALVLVLLASVATCGGPQRSAPAAVATASPSPSPTVVVPAQPVSFVSADGVMLSGTLFGQGSRAVVLSNEGNNASAPWLPVAQMLAAQGYLVLSYGYQPTDAAFTGLATHALADLRAAVAFLDTRSVTHIILIGASLGALISLKAASTLRCEGLVAISSPIGYQDVQLSDTDLSHLAMAKLFVTSADNQPFAADTLHLFDVSPEPKEKRVYAGDAHGTALFLGVTGADLLPALLRFVQQAAPTS